MNTTGQQWSSSARDRHPAWCAQGHRCALGEHRSRPMVVHIPDAGRVVLTRVQTADGTQHADIVLTAALPADQTAASYRLTTLLTHLRNLIGPAVRGRR